MKKINRIKLMKYASFSQLAFLGEREANLKELASRTEEVEFFLEDSLSLSEQDIWNKILFPFYAYVYCFDVSIYKKLEIYLLSHVTFVYQLDKHENVMGTADHGDKKVFRIYVNINNPKRCNSYSLAYPVTLIHELIHYKQKPKFCFSILNEKYGYLYRPHEIEARYVSRAFYGFLMENTNKYSEYAKAYKEDKVYLFAELNTLNTYNLPKMKTSNHKKWLRRTIVLCIGLIINEGV